MQPQPRRIPFQVDVAGVIRIMGKSLYSRGDAPLRELLQNAHDAVMRRRQREIGYRGRIDIRLDPVAKTLSISDDGIGLSPDEAEKYLGTLGIGITGLLKGHHPHAADHDVAGHGDGLIGQFGIGLFSAFLPAERLTVESRRLDHHEGVRWSAGEGTEIEIVPCGRTASGTTVTLHLKPEHAHLSEEPAAVEASVREFADFLPIPIHLNDSATRLNIIEPAWFDPTPDPEAIELALQHYFDETPLAVIPVNVESPVVIKGALYVTPQRTPGFTDEATLAVTVRRMVVTRQARDLLPAWASFVRGVLELSDCAPTAGREDLVRDRAFEHVRDKLTEILYEHLETLAKTDPPTLDAILAWHRYALAGAALSDNRLRSLLRTCYRFHTSRGPLTFAAIEPFCTADPLFETEADRVVWCNTDRRQERWLDGLFAGHDAICVHAVRSFEESLLACFAADLADINAAGESLTVALRTAGPASPGFAPQILGIRDVEDAPPAWQEFFAATEARILVATFRDEVPVLAFLNEKHELQKTYDDLRKQGNVPAGFQRLIDTHFEQAPVARNEILLNQGHRLVGRALSQRVGTPLAGVLRVLVGNALTAAGAALPKEAQQQQADDLDWIADALWGKKE